MKLLPASIGDTELDRQRLHVKTGISLVISFSSNTSPKANYIQKPYAIVFLYTALHY